MHTSTIFGIRGIVTGVQHVETARVHPASWRQSLHFRWLRSDADSLLFVSLYINIDIASAVTGGFNWTFTSQSRIQLRRLAICAVVDAVVGEVISSLVLHCPEATPSSSSVYCVVPSKFAGLSTPRRQSVQFLDFPANAAGFTYTYCSWTSASLVHNKAQCCYHRLGSRICLPRLPLWTPCLV